MDLKKYIESRGFTIKEFAERIDVHPTTISNWLHYRRRPSLEVANRVVELTKGKVTIKDLLAYWEVEKTHG